MGVTKLTDMVMGYDSLLIMCSAWVLIQALTKAFPKVAAHPLTARLKPVASVLLCSGAVWLPGVYQGASMEFGNRVLLGVILGAGSGQAHKILKQTILGEDKHIKKKGKNGLG